MDSTVTTQTEKDSFIIQVDHLEGNSNTNTDECLHEQQITYDATHISKTGVSVFDVAAYIIDKIGQTSTVKLQKLVYYCQAWSLVWDDAPLFPESIEAWVNGPVVRDLFLYHKGKFLIDSIPIGIPAKLSLVQKETVDAVIQFYGQKSSQQLVEISHLESPWKQARLGLAYDERGHNVISLDSMAEYYSSISMTS